MNTKHLKRARFQLCYCYMIIYDLRALFNKALLSPEIKEHYTPLKTFKITTL
jgi:hypothetical protein